MVLRASRYIPDDPRLKHLEIRPAKGKWFIHCTLRKLWWNGSGWADDQPAPFDGPADAGNAIEENVEEMVIRKEANGVL